MVILAAFIGAFLGFAACAMCSTGKSADEAIEMAFAERVRGVTWIDFPPSSEPIPPELLR
jgi:hypothetical protein